MMIKEEDKGISGASQRPVLLMYAFNPLYVKSTQPN
jgi:hypothetical protein